MSKVIIQKCSDYKDSAVSSAIASIFEALDLKSVIKPGAKVLLKPNLLMNSSPEKAATTHPAVVKAVADEVREFGGLPYLGDSPGGIGSLYPKVLRDTGMEDLGIPIVDLESKGMRKFDNVMSKVKPLYISNAVLDFKLVINIPKMKTHELTLVTCGIKNLLGCVPGLYKARYHLEAQTAEEFSEALVDIFDVIRPCITIVDAVTSMEGQGPSNGHIRDTGIIIASTDTVACDAVCSKLMGFEPLEIHTTRIAHERGLGEGNIENIHIIGEVCKPFEAFKRPSGLSMMNKLPAFIKKMLKPVLSLIKAVPEINVKKCVKCMMCVNSCPSKAIDAKSFKIDRSKCIMCFCCRELCGYGAVDLKESILWKILKKR